ncbi:MULTISPECIES: serine hydrolase domain-containing protein [Stenotrophomonas]|jgi:beta-lactamase class C|uniref:Beta-lactamase n=1 Tax=Stenotrophomonas acidaminiphila TaxID=128780 RepID=A0A0R0E860_9GAMM|nr:MULTISPECIES: serine hydrolase domain-containing protein [Stenotrophomonas]ALJ29024.1 beta-lactamase [Stenotrophomonas acidaminiphila]KRG86414.1 beta-lactamase [Stenotrophomonas acidaminiphila]OZB54041.1 MAG: serine hydrolase [Stenotrophomonas sp. 14-69-23]QOF97754.1 beta-lactamase family protein [Stenotrophomonas sp. CW117]
MKDNSRRRRFRPVASGLLGVLMPFALSTTAQTPTAPQPLPESPPQLPVNLENAPMQSPTQPMPYRVALRPDQVQALPDGFNVAAIESMAEQLTYGNRVPGIAMAIVQNGRVLSARGFGVTDIGNPQPVDAHTVFRLASLSKAFAGTMAGLLVNDGTLRWDSKVTDYVPGFQLGTPEATHRLTVADVLSHRVGLPYNAYDRDIEANADYYTLTRKLASAPLKCEPGDCYAYQNVAFSLIGDVVYAASGSFYEQAVERRIFKPLGMNDASLGLAGIQASPRWARPHVRSRNGWVSLSPKPTYYRVAPAAGVNASASDMAQWLLAHTGHRQDVLPAPLLATLHAPLVNTPGEMRSGWRRQRLDSAGYALGWRVFDYAGHTVVFHAGAVQGYRGLVALLPERDLGIAVMWNGESSVPSGLMPTILDRAIGLPTQRWLDVDTDFGSDNLMAEDTPANPPRGRKGVASDRATASPH